MSLNKLSFAVIIYSIFFFFFLRLYMCVPVLNWQFVKGGEKGPTLLCRNKKNKAADSVIYLRGNKRVRAAEGERLPRFHWLKQHNLFSKKYIQSHVHFHL